MPLADQVKARNRRRKDAEARKPKAEAPPAADPRPDDQVADPADIAGYCCENGAMAAAADLIRSRATWGQVKAAVGRAEAIRAMVADAGSITATITAADAERYIAAGASVEGVRAEIWNRVVDAQSPEIIGTITAETGADTGRSRAARSRQTAIDRINAEIDARSGGRAVSAHGAAPPAG